MKIALLLIIAGLAVFLFGIPYLDNIEINKNISLLKNEEKGSDVEFAFASTEFAKLPVIVKKYLNKSIKDKSTSHIFCNISLVGKTKAGPNWEWMDTKSTINYSLTEPGFIEISETYENYPLWTKRVDSYVNSEATTSKKYLSSIKLNSFNGNKLNRSYLILYLMESIFSPTVLLPNMNIQWKQIDKFSAKATLWNDQLQGSAIFYFNSKNEVTKITSDNRYMPGKTDYSKESFTMHLANYKEIGNYYIPTYFELQWNLIGNDLTFGMFQIIDILYE